MKHTTRTLMLAFTLATASAAIAPAIAYSAGDNKSPGKTTTAVKPYPLTVCLVTDNDLGSMGDEQRFVYDGQEIKLCCKPCERKFMRNPDKYMKKLSSLVAQTAAT